MSSGYLRYPHVHGDLLTFVAGDDVWLAPAEGGRAWRLSADDAPVSHPRFSRDGSRVAWTRVDPDVEVLITPDDAAAGRDPQLEAAVQLALEALEKQPPPVPPDTVTGPVKSRRPLPPRGSA
jgi:hypothetical protein